MQTPLMMAIVHVTIGAMQYYWKRTLHAKGGVRYNLGSCGVPSKNDITSTSFYWIILLE